MFMIKTVLRNLLRRPATRPYPFVQREAFPLSRGHLVNHVETCIFCRLCATKCPSRCISVDPKAGVWHYDPFACVYCGVCAEACPTHSLQMYTARRAPEPKKFTVSNHGTPRALKGKPGDGAKIAPAAAPATAATSATATPAEAANTATGAPAEA